jgi:hypothetical protein
MRRTGLRTLVGVICALGFIAGPSAPALARRPAAARPRWCPLFIVSPDHRHRVELRASGQLELDGRPLAGAARPLARPVWRRDSRALAFLQRGATGVELRVVLLDDDPQQPLVWTLPGLTAQSCREVFWIAPQRIGVGEKALVPRMVVSWTTTFA